MSNPFISEYTRSRPASVARELEKFAVEDIAEFVEGLDPNLAGQVMASLSSRILLSLIRDLDPACMARILVSSTPRDAHVILSHVPGRDYQKFLDAADDTVRANLSALLGIGLQLIGLKTTDRLVRVFTDESCGSVLRELAASDEQESLPLVAVNRQGLYIGVVPILEIVRSANGRRRVGDLAVEVQPIRADASISSAIELREWDEYSTLPVVNEGGRLEGVVALRDLKDGFTPTAPETTHPFLSVLDAIVGAHANVIDLFFGERAS